jgi:hypothetical protein
MVCDVSTTEGDFPFQVIEDRKARRIDAVFQLRKGIFPLPSYESVPLATRHRFNYGRGFFPFQAHAMREFVEWLAPFQLRKGIFPLPRQEVELVEQYGPRFQLRKRIFPFQDAPLVLGARVLAAFQLREGILPSQEGKIPAYSTPTVSTTGWI